jgi:YVTN family beta-propeller protein
MKTKSVVLLSTLATAALLLIAGFAILSTVVEFTNPPVVVGACEDAYEPDNDYTTATTVTVPSLTSHNFDNADDKDWVVFSGTAGTTYTIKTMNLAVSGTRQVDTKLLFHWWDGSDLVQLHSDADGGDEKWASKIVWPITTTGWYYVHVGHIVHSLSFWGCDATYDLAIIRTGVPCTTTLVIEPDTLLVGGTATMTATVVDCSSSPLAGQVITFSTTAALGSGGISPITATTDANGQAVSYISSTLAGIKLVTATAPNLVAGTDTVTFTTLGGCEDDYEWDDSPADATTVTPPGTTRHNFHDEGDTDWVRFWGYEGITYTIETMNLAISGTKHVDTKLVFYWWDGSGLVHLATHDDDGDEPFADKIVWPITTTGWYYVNVGHVEGSWSFSGCDATYDLSIILTGVPCTTTLVIEPDTLLIDNTATMTATVVDCSSSPLAGQVITFSTTSDLGSGGISPITATTNANGQAVSYISSTITGIKLVTATAPNLVAGTDTVTFIVPDGCEDEYELDDSRAEATIVTPPNTTRHNFHDDGDVDWIGFWGTAGITYTIETLNLTTNLTTTVDTELDFYSWDGSTLTWLATHDDRDWPDDLSSIITWVVTTDGWYYVVAGRFTGSDYGCDAYYDLRITGPPAHVYLPIILKNHPPAPPTPIPPPPPGPCYPLVETSITVGNDPRGVAYNGDDNLIYVANNGDDTVSVINGANYDDIELINGVVGANGVAYDSDHGLVYVTNQSIGMLTVISATTNTIVETIPVGDQPNGVAYNPRSHKVYVANYADDTVTIIDANTMSVLTTVPTGDEPAHVTVNPSPISNKVYVSNHGDGTVTVIHGTTNDVVDTVSLLGSSGPYGIAADTQRNLIYVVSIEVADLNAPNLVTIDGANDEVKDNMWGKVNIHKSDDSLVPLRVIAVHPYLGPSAGGGHLYITSSSGDIAGDSSHGTDQLLMSRKGWPEGFNKPNPLDVGSRPEEGIAVDLANNRVFVTARYANQLTVIRDTGDHSQLCSEAFTLDGYVIEPVP